MRTTLRWCVAGLVALMAVTPEIGATETGAFESETTQRTPTDPAVADPASELDGAGESDTVAAAVERELRRRHDDARSEPSMASRQVIEQLRWDGGLTRLARNHATTMAWEFGELTHRRRALDDRITHDWFARLWRCAMGPVGENLAWYLADQSSTLDSVDIANRLFAQWMSSPSHRANVLNPGHDAIGIGVVVGPYGGFWAVTYLGDFDGPVSCPVSNVALSSARWGHPSPASPDTMVATVELAIGVDGAPVSTGDMAADVDITGTDVIEQANVVVKLEPWARVIRGSTAAGHWLAAPNQRSGLWAAGDTPGDSSSTVRLAIEFPRERSPHAAVADLFVSSDWGASVPAIPD